MALEWKSDIDPTDKDLEMHKENVQLVFDEAKEQVRASLDTHGMLNAKANGLLGFIVALSTGLVAFIVNKQADWPVYPLLAIYLLCALFSLVKTLHVLWPQAVDVNGYWPHLLFQKEFVTQKPTELRARLIGRYAKRIEHNAEVNKIMKRKLKSATLWYLAGSGIFVSGYLATSFFPRIGVWIATAVCK